MSAKNVGKRAELRMGQEVSNALGYGVWWTLSEGEISVPEMEKLLKSTLGLQYMPGKPRKKRALRLALESVEKAGLIVKIRDDEGICAYGLAEEVADRAAIDFKVNKKNIIVLDKAKGTIEFRMAHKNSEIEALFAKYQDVYTEQDYRPIALAFLYANNGITLRDSGGIYFLPSVDAVLKMRDYFAGLKCEFYYLPITADKESTKQVAKIAADELQRDIELAAADVAHYTGKDDTRDATLAARLNKFDMLWKRAAAYGDLLQLDAQSLHKKIEEMRGVVEKSLMGTDEHFEHEKVYPYKCRVKFTDEQDEYNNKCGAVVGFLEEGEGKKKRPVVKVLFDDGKIFNVYAEAEFLKRV